MLSMITNRQMQAAARWDTAMPKEYTPGNPGREFRKIIKLIRDTAKIQMKTRAGREALRRDLCAMQGRPLGPAFEGETDDNWGPKTFTP